MEKLHTLKEAKKLPGVTTKTIQRWDKEGKIRVVRKLAGEGPGLFDGLMKLWNGFTLTGEADGAPVNSRGAIGW